MNQEDDKNEVDSWLNSLGEGVVRNIRQVVVSALNVQRQFGGEDTFQIPFNLFERARIRDKDKQLSILTNLHKREFIKVINITSGESIVDNPAVFNQPDTMITIFPQKFDYLVKKLNEIVCQYEAIKNKTDTTSKLDNMSCCGITYSFDTCELRYKNEQPQTMSPDVQGMKFFISLYQQKGKVVSDKDIARDVGMYSYTNLLDNGKVVHEEINNKDFSEAIAVLRRDFRTLVLSLGMPEEEFKNMIVRIPKKGYKLVCS